LRAAGYDASVSRCPGTAGVVVSQSVSGGSVNICVGSGSSSLRTPGIGDDGPGSQPQAGPSRVPGVVGMSLAKASGTLSRAGFRSASSRQCREGAQSGVVWGQSPGGGSSAPRGTTVTLYSNPPGCD
ncbi:MAG TPA: PASTA domain-containing protein, partial [Actinomycetota bacterium]|nr:PASTA domain-containing protein [Actinomycetota bacterium]